VAGRRHGDGLAQIDDRHAALQAVGGLHGDGAHSVLAQVLLHFGDDVDLLALDVGLDLQGVVDRRQVPALELDVDHGADDLHNATGIQFSDSTHRFLLTVRG